MNSSTPDQRAQLAARLRAILDSSDLTSTEMAGRMRLHYNTLRSYLRAERYPQKHSLVRMRKAFPALRDLPNPPTE